MLFSEVIGQNESKTFLLNTVKDKRISHAQIFLGKEGYGSLAMAIAYAQYIMCTNKQENDACGQCKSCKQVQKLVHPDLHFAFPTVGTKNNAPLISSNYMEQWRDFVTTNPYGTYQEWLSFIEAGNSQGSIKVKEAELIQQKLSLKSFESEFKILIMWFPELMNSDTANKLLKLLEEPPKKTLFLLVSNNTDLIIKTILSRTQIVNIKPILSNDILTHLTNNTSLGNEKAQQIAKMCDGNINTAYNLIETSEDMAYNFENFKMMMRLSYTGRFIELLKWVDDISKIGREKQKSFLRYSLKMLRDNLMLNSKNDDLARLSDEEKEFSVNFSRFITAENIFELSNELNLAYTHISRNANAKIVFLDTCININKLL